MPDALLNLLKLLLLALLYLFFFRVLRAVWAEISTRGMAAPAVVPAAPTAPAPTRAGSTGAGKTALRLKIVEGEQRGKVFEVGDELTVGRAAGCQIALADDTFVSQLH